MPETASPERPSRRFASIADALSNRDFGLFTIGNVASHIGTWVQRMAVGWLTWELTESTTWLGIVAFAHLFPTLLLAPLTGAVADRVGCCCGQAVRSGLVPTLEGVASARRFATLRVPQTQRQGSPSCKLTWQASYLHGGVLLRLLVD